MKYTYLLLTAIFFFSNLDAQLLRKPYVDVIVAYTADAQRLAGSSTEMVKQIEKAILQMNEAYVSSGVNHWIRLVRTIQIPFAEISCFQQQLADFANGLDTLAYVHRERNNYYADLASLIVANNQFAGLALSDSSVSTASTAFCSVQYQCMVRNHSLAHMLGHLYGCGHAQFELDPPAKGVAFPYAHDYAWSYNNDASFNTIMAMTDDVICYGSGADDNCHIINYFSNPAVSYQGVATGTEFANNVKVLNTQLPVLGLFKPIPRISYVTDTVKNADYALALSVDSLYTGAAYKGKDSARIYFKAGKKIVLGPGFSIDSGAYFKTEIDTSINNSTTRNVHRINRQGNLYPEDLSVAKLNDERMVAGIPRLKMHDAIHLPVWPGDFNAVTIQKNSNPFSKPFGAVFQNIIPQLPEKVSGPLILVKADGAV